MSLKARLARLAVRDFRNLAHVELSPPADGVVVIGENGQGKTNLLESIYYLQILRSARGARDQDLIRFGADAFHIAATVDTDRCHEIGVGFERAGKRKRVRLDGDVPERLSDALGALPSVLFSPADVDLVAGAPAAPSAVLAMRSPSCWPPRSSPWPPPGSDREEPARQPPARRPTSDSDEPEAGHVKRWASGRPEAVRRAVQAGGRNRGSCGR